MKPNKPKIKIGIVGEHPNNDSEAMAALLRPVATAGIQFSVLFKNLRGSQLDSPKFLRNLKAEFDSEKLEQILFVRDLDGLFSETEKVRSRDAWFKKANSEINGCGLFFLAIFELEALILADTEGLNAFFKINSKASKSPILIENPKETLQKLTEKSQKGRYEENLAPEIFKNLSFENIRKRHGGERSFQAFADEMAAKKWIVLKS